MQNTKTLMECCNTVIEAGGGRGLGPVIGMIVVILTFLGLASTAGK